MNTGKTPKALAAEIRSILKRGGSAEHAKGVQWFFKEEITSHGWRTADLRRLAHKYARAVLKERGLAALVSVADRLLRGRVLEETIFAVLMLESLTDRFDNSHFELFESWLARISSWADHDALVHYLIGPMIAADPSRAQNVFVWAESKNRWHRRAACVALIQGTRKKMFFPEITRLSNRLLRDDEDVVQKGLGWLLRETAKADASRTVPYLMKIRHLAPRLVLRTACETLPPRVRARVLRAG
jgi:3-methyladenine DNA glycosylase AlkD